MKSSDLFVLILAGAAVFYGYNMNTGPSPDGDLGEVSVEYSVEEFPGPPEDPQSVVILSKLDSVVFTPDAAIGLARAFKQYGELVNKDTSIENLSQLSLVHKAAAEWLAEGAGNPPLGGKLNAVVKELYEHELSFLKKDGKISSIELGPANSPTRVALQRWFFGLSSKMAEIFNESIPDQL